MYKESGKLFPILFSMKWLKQNGRKTNSILHVHFLISNHFLQFGMKFILRNILQQNLSTLTHVYTYTHFFPFISLSFHSVAVKRSDWRSVDRKFESRPTQNFFFFLFLHLWLQLYFTKRFLFIFILHYYFSIHWVKTLLPKWIIKRNNFCNNHKTMLNTLKTKIRLRNKIRTIRIRTFKPFKAQHFF